MLDKIKNRKQEGFTIIEVLIVLAIAGLIILIVLLAVPALQRNGRNTAAKNDASAVAGAINEFKSNNDGSAPNQISGTGTVTVTSNVVANPVPATARVQGSVTPVVAAAATSANPIAVAWNTACPGGQSSSRTVAVYYWVETAGGGASKCIDS